MKSSDYQQLLLDFIEEQIEAERPLKHLPTLPKGPQTLCGYQVKPAAEGFRLWLVYQVGAGADELRWEKAGLFYKELEARVVGHYLVRVAKVDRSDRPASDVQDRRPN